MPFEKSLSSSFAPPGGRALVPIEPFSADLRFAEPSHFRVGTSGLPVRAACRVVRQMVAEIMALLGDRVLMRRDRRRYACHIRQISMYVCHVALRVPLVEIGLAFGRDRTTVSHACHVVEDRRDDQAFDELVSSMERIAIVAFGLSEAPFHE